MHSQASTPRPPPLAWQPPDTLVLHSIERSGLTPVFGTSVPPAGLSGRIRRLAFHWSEGDLRHWLLLLLADRIQVGEGVLSDLARGHVPNLWAEMGLRSEWRYNRWRFLRRIGVLMVLVGVPLALALARARRQHPLALGQ